jgi:hypothetical protein
MSNTTKDEQSNDDILYKTYNFLEQEQLLLTDHDLYLKGIDLKGGKQIRAETPKEYEQYITLPHIQSLSGEDFFENIREEDYDSKLNIGDYILFDTFMKMELGSNEDIYGEEIRRRVYEIVKITPKRIYVRHLRIQDIVYYYDDYNIDNALGRLTKKDYCTHCKGFVIITKNRFNYLTKINIQNDYMYMYDRVLCNHDPDNKTESETD